MDEFVKSNNNLVSVEVNTIWTEMVKPLHPTPPHLDTMRLSILDQLVGLFHVPTLVFYPTPNHGDRDYDEMVNTMKLSLSKTLSKFYPFAGRLLDDSTILCNDEGVPLIYTKFACALKSCLPQRGGFDHKKELIDKLLPPKHVLHGSHSAPIPISAWVQVAVQINVFECGGVVIGTIMNHKLIDGISATTFLQYWAGECLGLGRKHLVQPDFDSIATSFPPNDYAREEMRTAEKPELNSLLNTTTAPTTITTTVRAFVFDLTAITAIKEKAATVRIPNPTRVESVIAFLWKHCVESQNHVGPTDLVLTVDMRQRAIPPIPNNSIGNLANIVVAQADKTELELGALVEKVRGVVRGFDHEKIREIQGEEGGRTLWDRRKTRGPQGPPPLGHNTYIVSCQCRGGFTDVDFGFGKPIMIYPFAGVLPMMPTHNFITLLDHIDSTKGNGGIEAWLTLDKIHMQTLQTNPHFFAFASPLDPPII